MVGKLSAGGQGWKVQYLCASRRVSHYFFQRNPGAGIWLNFFTMMPKYDMHKRTVLCLIVCFIWQRHQLCPHHLLVLDLCHFGISAFVAVLCHWYRDRIDRAPFLLLVYPSLQHGAFFSFFASWLPDCVPFCLSLSLWLLLYLLQLRASWIAVARSISLSLFPPSLFLPLSLSFVCVIASLP
jgi:hypothetical protein